MSRSFTYSALTLRVKHSGESNREAWFLSAEEGIIRATVFGGPKSKLRSLVAPFHEGKLWIYHDPVRDSRKVSDFDVQSWRPGIRELYERAMTADAVAETILASHGGGGNWEEAVKLAGSVLDSLDKANAAACPILAIYFFWHWAQILGIRPEISENISLARNTSFRLESGTILFLEKIESLNAASLAEISAEASSESLGQAMALSQAILANALGRRLSTWEGI